VALFLFVSVWIRASWPRIRYDKLMDLGWKWLLPLGLANVVLTAIVIVIVPGDIRWVEGILLFVLGIGTLYGVSRLGGPDIPTSPVDFARFEPPAVSQSERKSV
jgi:NADH-quinone oxidoreductase subunit H